MRKHGSLRNNALDYTTLVLDHFTDSDNTRLNDHTPDIDDVGAGWDELSGTWDIDSNRATMAAAPSQSIAVIDAGVSDFELHVVLETYDTSNSGVVLRATDDDNYVLLIVDSNAGTFQFWIRDGGTFSNQGASVAQVAADGDLLVVTVNGDTFLAYLNGELILSKEIAFNKTATKHGIRHHAETDPMFDDFEIRDL